jgi:hypothetical protein
MHGHLSSYFAFSLFYTTLVLILPQCIFLPTALHRHQHFACISQWRYSGSKEDTVVQYMYVDKILSSLVTIK